MNININGTDVHLSDVIEALAKARDERQPIAATDGEIVTYLSLMIHAAENLERRCRTPKPEADPVHPPAVAELAEMIRGVQRRVTYFGGGAHAYIGIHAESLPEGLASVCKYIFDYGSSGRRCLAYDFLPHVDGVPASSVGLIISTNEQWVAPPPPPAESSTT